MDLDSKELLLVLICDEQDRMSRSDNKNYYSTDKWLLLEKTKIAIKEILFKEEK